MEEPLLQSSSPASTSGMNARKPRDITRKLTTDMDAIWYGPFFLHRSRLSTGESIRRIEGDPKIPCNLSGSGNNAAPAMEVEKANIIITGKTFKLAALHARQSPNTNNTLSAEQASNPAMKTY